MLLWRKILNVTFLQLNFILNLFSFLLISLLLLRNIIKTQLKYFAQQLIIID